MSSVSYASKYRDPAVEIDHEGDEVRIWVGLGPGQTFTRDQWKDLILSEYERLGGGSSRE